MNKLTAVGVTVFIAVLSFVGYYLYTSGNPSAPSVSKTANAKYTGKKILYIDSYHEGYAWSDGITKGISETLYGTGVDLQILRMDTKNNTSEEFKKQAGIEAKTFIDEYQPDVVIISDDNAVKYVLKEFYRDSSIPFIYCGLNWDSSVYDLPYRNTTGMVEVSLTTQLIDKLKQYTPGRRLGYLSADTETERKNLENYQKLLNLNFTKSAFVKTFEEWRNAFIKMQSEVDILIFENNAGITGWDDKQAEAIALEYSAIPSGTLNDWVANTVLVGYTKVPEEQGVFSAEAAIKILNGVNPKNILEETNKRGDLILNLKIANKLDVIFSTTMIKAAKTLIK